MAQKNFEKACEFYENMGLLDTAAEVAKRIGDFDRSNNLYDKAIQCYIKLGRPDIATELKERNQNPQSTFHILDDFLCAI